MARSKPKRLLALLVAVASVVALAGSTASAAGPNITCVMSGNVPISPGIAGGWDWRISGSGPCLDLAFAGPYTATAVGSGHSDTLGLCDGLLVTNLKLTVTLTVTNLRTGKTRIVTEKWSAGISTFPVATPFLIGGGQSGIGVISTRVLLNCPPAGTPGATMVFNTTT